VKKLLSFRVTLTKNGQRVQRRTFKSKTRVFNFVQVSLASELNVDGGTVRVIYDGKNDYWNEFDFETLAELKDKMAPCVEAKLLQSF
jgi:hypothetical protein